MEQNNTYAHMIDTLSRERQYHAGNDDMMYVKNKCDSLRWVWEENKN